MWFKNILNILLTRWPDKSTPVKEHLEYYCRCYARGEINREDFEELKHDLLEFEKQFETTKQRKSTPRMNIRKNNKQPVR